VIKKSNDKFEDEIGEDEIIFESMRVKAKRKYRKQA